MLAILAIFRIRVRIFVVCLQEWLSGLHRPVDVTVTLVGLAICCSSSEQQQTDSTTACVSQALIYG